MLQTHKVEDEGKPVLPEFMEKLEPQVRKLKPGTRLVAHDYPFPNLKAEQVFDFQGPYREHTLYLWVVKEDWKDEKKGQEPASRSRETS